ncbi:MAG: insulinase family protein [Betaproteobacteria bacterium]|nr:insulinase family protein [Betaproteobacteria bacterium]
MRRHVFIPLLGLVGALLAPLVHANPFEHKLPNGLSVIVKEDRRAPTAVHMVWYRAGSMDESNGTTGVAHVLEHMMFKGTPKVGAGEFNRLVAAAGGRDNAFTSRDYTAYFQQVPQEKLGEMMALEADRMRHLNLSASEFEQEIKVVMEERRLRTDDQPQSLLFEAMNAAAFQSHPYRRPIIGWMNDLENMTVQDARDWYARWYVPNNAYVIVIGDVDHKDVFRAAEKHYGTLKARPLPARKPQEEPTQTGTRRVTVKAPAELPVLIMGYRAPIIRDVEKDIDPYALEMLGAVLSGHGAARFSRHLVREQRLAVSAGAEYDSSARGPGMFYLVGTPSEGKSVAEMEAGLRAEIAKVQVEGVTAEELNRAKAQLVAGQVYKLDSMFAQAMEIGQLEAVGLPYRSSERIIEQLKAVTAEQVQSVAKRYFSDDSLTVGVLDPQPLAGAPRRSFANVRH